ncbi:MAG: sulfite exporter TauE/SafE family protein [Candidatus Omnitrophica bacterium]|nr:sulfite exporter TauE/SafE family protein [Candidatus Omnitrophota bacterium]
MVYQAVILSIFTFLAAIIGTISGFGISTIMIPVMTLFYPLPTVLLFVAIIHLCGDIWKIILFKKGANWKLIAAFGIPGIIMSYLGASITLTIPAVSLKKLLGIFLILYVVYLFMKQKWKIPKTNISSVIGGSLSGFFAGIFGVGGAIRGAFLSAYDLPKETYIYSAGMIAFFIDISRITKYLTGGMTLNKYLLILLLFLVPLSFIGAFTAKKIVNFIPQKSFRLVIAVLLGFIGLKFLIYP